MASDLQKIGDDFVSRLSLPNEKPDKQIVLGIVGLPGSGRTTVAKQLASKITGSVLVQANSARYLLKEANLSWGDNVREVLKYVARHILDQGYSVVFDGNAADEKDRQNISEFAGSTPIYYVQINIDPEIAKQREKAKYDDSGWISNFEEFKVNSTEKMLQNIDDRSSLHQELDSSSIPNLIGVLDNNGSLEELKKQVDELNF